MLCFREIDRQRKEEKRNEKKRGGAGGENEEGGDGSQRAKAGRGRAPLARALRGDVAEAAGSSPSPIPAVFLLHSRLFLPASPPPPPPQRGTIFSFLFLLRFYPHLPPRAHSVQHLVRSPPLRLWSSDLSAAGTSCCQSSCTALHVPSCKSVFPLKHMHCCFLRQHNRLLLACE